MAADLGDRVLLGRPALRIEDDAPDRMRVVTPVETFTADRVIVAMAPADTMRIEFAPALPKARQELASGWARLPRLPLVKAAVLYKSPFWRADSLNGAMQSDRGAIQLVFDKIHPRTRRWAFSAASSRSWSAHSSQTERPARKV